MHFEPAKCRMPSLRVNGSKADAIRHFAGIFRPLVSDTNCCAVAPRFESREDMDVCKCIVPSRHGATLISRRAANPLVRLVAWDGKWRPLTLPQGVIPPNQAENELIRSVTCMVLKATANDRRHLALCHDKFRGS
ncbi:uncharacterized protein TNCV_3845131 [Trichonephila clavipes]|nr:uncharacterized protein TNCV_3845131 [Trichonephila clavipes]